MDHFSWCKASVLVVVLGTAAAACSAGSSSGNVTGSDIAAPLLFKLEHIEVAPKGLLSVYQTGAWAFDSWDTCSALKGMLSPKELEQLSDYVNDSSLDALSTEVGSCPAQSFELSRRNHEIMHSICWKSDDSASSDARAAMDAVLRFFDSRIEELHWDGVVQDCKQGGPSGESGPTPRGQISGSDAPKPR